MKLIQGEETLSLAAARAGMDKKTARRHRDTGKLPSQTKIQHTWRTRADPFAEVWDDPQHLLELNPGLEAKTLFDHLQRHDRGRFQDGQLRTLQRRVKTWRALHGPARDVFFPQTHRPGVLSQSDFADRRSLAITIRGQAFDHLVFHFVLTYSNWEVRTRTIVETSTATTPTPTPTPADVYQPLARLQVSPGRVQFLFASAGACIILSDASINGVVVLGRRAGQHPRCRRCWGRVLCPPAIQV